MSAYQKRKSFNVSRISEITTFCDILRHAVFNTFVFLFWIFTLKKNRNSFLYAEGIKKLYDMCQLWKSYHFIFFCILIEKKNYIKDTGIAKSLQNSESDVHTRHNLNGFVK